MNDFTPKGTFSVFINVFFFSQDDMLFLSWRAYGRNMNVVQIPWRAIFSTLTTQKRFSLVHPELKYQKRENTDMSYFY